MATNFPGGVDNFVNPTASDTLDSPDHASQHSDANDAIEAIETALLDGAPLHIDDVNERVGIGTVTPSTELEVVGTVTATEFVGHLQGPTHIKVKNTSGGSLSKGTPVYASGSVGASGTVEVQASLAGTASTMPALGLLDGTLANNAEGSATIIGVIRQVDTSSYSVNDSLYVSVSGGLTNVRPTGASELVQKIGRVVRAHASTGEILVLGAGRANDVPNGLSPTITLSGDASGSVTLTELGDGTLSVTVADNSHNHSYLPLSGGTISGSLTATSNIESQGNLVITRPDALMLNGASDNNHKIYSANAADTGLPFSDGPVLVGHSGWAMYDEQYDTWRMGVRGSNTSGVRYGWYNCNLMIGSAPNDSINTHTLRVQGTGYFTGSISSGSILSGTGLSTTRLYTDSLGAVTSGRHYVSGQLDVGGVGNFSAHVETDQGMAVYGGTNQSSINNTYVGRSSIQLAVDTYWGGCNTQHSGFLITCGGMCGWGTSELSFRGSNNWGSYYTASALRLKGDRTYLSLGPETTYDVYSDGAGRIGYFGSRRELKNVVGYVAPENSLSRIKRLRPVEYTWKAEHRPSGDDTELIDFDVHRGFIAEDVAEVDRTMATWGWLYKEGDTADGKVGDALTEELHKTNQTLNDAEVISYDQRAIIADLVGSIQALEARIVELEAV